jgi:hypothetical protein
LQNFGKLSIAERTILIIRRRRRFALWNEGQGARAFTANPLEHRKVVLLADLENPGNDLAIIFLRQYPTEEPAALLLREALGSKRQRARYRESGRVIQPGRIIVKDHLSTVILYEMADELLLEIDIECACHDPTPCLPEAGVV